jgi:hypothetical protein
MQTLTKDNITLGQRSALTDALVFGDIWRKTDGNWGSRFHHIRVLNKLVASGLLKYRSSYNESGGTYAGGWILTEKGQELARSLPDYESSASRQHYIDTGKYIPLGAREELNPPEFAVGDTVKNDDEVGVDGYLIVARHYIPDLQGWLYDVEVIGGGNDGTHFDGCVIGTQRYHVVNPDQPDRDWEILAPVAAQAATLVALGRGDEMVEDYQDGVITALELLTELVEAGK